MADINKEIEEMKEKTRGLERDLAVLTKNVASLKDDLNTILAKYKEQTEKLKDEALSALRAGAHSGAVEGSKEGSLIGFNQAYKSTQEDLKDLLDEIKIEKTAARKATRNFEAHSKLFRYPAYLGWIGGGVLIGLFGREALWPNILKIGGAFANGFKFVKALIF